MVPIFEMKEKTDTPPEILHALGDDFFAKINVVNPPPILLQELKNGALGICTMDEGQTSFGEISIDPVLLQLPNQFKSTYIHEMSHRVLSKIGTDFGHGGAFFCLNYCLHLRAGIGHFVALYDIKDVPNNLLPATLSFVLPLAKQLSESKNTAENCAKIIVEKITDEMIITRHSEPAKLKSKIIDLEEIIKNAKYIAWQNYAAIAGLGVLAWVLK